MEEPISERKSQYVLYRAGWKRPLRLTVGTVEIYTPGHEGPICLGRSGLTVIVTEGKGPDDLRELKIVARQLYKYSLREVCMWAFIAVLGAFAVARLFWLL